MVGLTVPNQKERGWGGRKAELSALVRGVTCGEGYSAWMVGFTVSNQKERVCGGRKNELSP
jgi:hypothetical protein